MYYLVSTLDEPHPAHHWASGRSGSSSAGGRRLGAELPATCNVDGATVRRVGMPHCELAGFGRRHRNRHLSNLDPNQAWLHFSAWQRVSEHTQPPASPPVALPPDQRFRARRAAVGAAVAVAGIAQALAGAGVAAPQVWRVVRPAHATVVAAQALQDGRALAAWVRANAAQSLGTGQPASGDKGSWPGTAAQVPPATPAGLPPGLPLLRLPLQQDAPVPAPSAQAVGLERAVSTDLVRCCAAHRPPPAAAAAAVWRARQPAAQLSALCTERRLLPRRFEGVGPGRVGCEAWVPKCRLSSTLRESRSA